MAQNRSESYNWFKGPKGQDKKHNRKVAFKTTWKFVRIFLLFSVFFISMYGCVQTFTVKQSLEIGKGLEFYMSEKEVTPHVTSINIKDSDPSTPAAEVYDEVAEMTTNTFWMNQKVYPTELAKVHEAVKNQNLEGNLKLSDAFKGINEAIQIQTNGNFATQPVVEGLVLSSLAQRFDHTSFDNDITKFPQNIYLWTFDDSRTPKWESLQYDLTPIVVPQTPTGQARLDFKTSIWNKIISQSPHTREVLTSSAAPTFDATHANDFINAQRSAAQILSYLGFKFTEPSAAGQHGTFALDVDYMPSDDHSQYRPIVTWHDGWVRGVGPFYGLFVWPISKMISGIIDGLPIMAGWESVVGMLFAVIILRLIGFAIGFKGTLQQTKMQEMQARKAAIDAKYAPYKGNKQMETRQKQEVAEFYKKEGVNPLSSISTIFISMPIFLSIWRVIGALPHFKSTIWLGINFSATSWRELVNNHHWNYLPLMIIAVGTSLFSNFYTQILTRRRDKRITNVYQRAALKKNNRTQNIVMFMMAFISVIFNAGVQIYWIIGAFWTLFQTQLTHHILIWQSKKRRQKR